MFSDVDSLWDKQAIQTVDNPANLGLIFSKTCASVDIPFKNILFLWITLWTLWTEQVFEAFCSPGHLCSRTSRNPTKLHMILLRSSENPLAYSSNSVFMHPR